MKYKNVNHEIPRREHRQNTDIKHSSIFLAQSSKAKEIKAKINKGDPTKLNNVGTAKYTIDRNEKIT